MRRATCFSDCKLLARYASDVIFSRTRKNGRGSCHRDTTRALLRALCSPATTYAPAGRIDVPSIPWATPPRRAPPRSAAARSSPPPRRTGVAAARSRTSARRARRSATLETTTSDSATRGKRSARARRARSSRTRRRGSSGSASSRFVSTCTCGDGSRATEASGLAATRHGSPPRIDSARSSFLSSIASISAAREDQSERPSDAGCVAPRLGERRPLDRDAASIALDSARWCDASAAPGVACADGKGE